MPRSRSRFQQKIYMNNIFSEVLYLISSTGNAPAFHLDAHKIQIYPAPAIAQPRCLWLCSATTIRTIKKKKKWISVELTLTYTHASAALAYTLTREYTQPPRVKQQKKKKRAHKHTKTLWETWCSVQQRNRMSATFNYSLTHMQPPVLSRRQPTKPNVSLCWLCMCICIAVCIFFLRLYSVRSLCVLCVMWVCVCLLCLYDCGEWLLCMCVRCVCVRVVYFRFGIVLNRNNVSFFSNFAWFRGGKEVKELCCTPDVLWTS